MKDVLPIIVIAAFLGIIYFGGRGNLPDKGSQVALKPTSNSWIGTRSHDDKPESSIKIKSANGDSFDLSLYAGGVPYQERKQLDGGWSYEYEIHRYPIDFDADIGAWAGFRAAKGNWEKDESETGFDIGLRYSPVRFAYGVIAPDILISPRQAGIGISAYTPAQTVRYPFNKLGLGLGYLADYDGDSGWTPYLSLSTRF